MGSADHVASIGAERHGDCGQHVCKPDVIVMLRVKSNPMMSSSNPSYFGFATVWEVEHVFEVLSTQHVFSGSILSLRSDQVRMPGGVTAQRDVIELPGAVAVVALDENMRVLLIRQYRHSVVRYLWEVPAGILDNTLETPTNAGRRELFEEGHLHASTWHALADIVTSPGVADETVRLLLARDLEAVAESERYVGSEEEAEMTSEWVPLTDAVNRCLAGDLENGLTVSALLAAEVARSRGFQGLRTPDAPWRARKR